jgi:hypothetical protein
MSSDEPTKLASELLQEADEAFVNRCQERMELGQQKYGPTKFLGVDTLEEAMQEVLDLSNYARLTYIKLYLLQKGLPKIVNKHPAADKDGFVSTKNLMGMGDD